MSDLSDTQVKVEDSTDTDESKAPPQQPPPATSKKSKKKRSTTIIMGTIGALQPFDPTHDDFDMWYGQFEMFIIANNLSPLTHADRCVGIFLSSIGISTYTLLSNLLAPTPLSRFKLADLQTTLQEHFKPAPKALAERFKFTGRKQQPGESVNAFVAALRSLAVNCKFTDLEERIRDQFIFGLSSEGAQRSLFTKDDSIALKDTVALAVAQEAADSSTALVRGHQNHDSAITTEPVHKTSQYQTNSQSSSKGKGTTGKTWKSKSGQTQSSFGNTANNQNNNKSCAGCGSFQHTRNKCPHRESKCYGCGIIGHLQSVCRKGSQDNHHISLDNLSEISDLNCIRAKKNKTITLDVSINGNAHTMELDTGCETSIISKEFWRDTLQSPPLQKSNVVFRTYTNATFRPLGTLSCSIQLQNQAINHNIHVSKGTSLFGRDLLRLLKVDWNQVQRQCHRVSASNDSQLQALLQEYQDVFLPPTAADRIRHFKANIIMKDDAIPRLLKARPIPYSIRPKVDRELDHMEATGVITNVDISEWASPLVVVPKPDGRVRITGDFKNTVNSQLCVTQYPLGNPEDLLANVAGGTTFSKLDGANAYHQIEVDEASKKFLVVNTHRGLYRYNVLPQGIASSPAIFQQFMDTMLKGIPNTGSFVDDAITSGSTDADHLNHLRSIFEKMRYYNYKLSPPKCAFMQDKIIFLGHYVSQTGIQTTSEKIQTILQIPAPTTVTAVKSFLGLVNFYGKFVPHLSSICDPLYRLTRKDMEFNWSTKCQEAFEHVKQLLSSSPTLAHYDPTKNLGISCDASSTGLGSVLFIKEANGEERPLAYASKLLSDTERRYSQIEKEGLAIIFSVKKFYKYVCGRQFILVTDHKPLLSIFGPKSHLPPLVATRLHHWSLFLSQFQYEVVYRKSEDHGNADALSRLPSPPTNTVMKVVPASFSDRFRIGSSTNAECGLSLGESTVDSTICFLANQQVEVLPVTASTIRQATTKDPMLSKVLQLVLYGWPPKLRDEDKELQPYHSRRHELTIIQGILMWGIRVVIPSALQNQILRQLHECHSGIVRMKAIAREHVYWAGIDKNIEDIAKACESCQRSAASPPSAPLHPWSFPEKPWQRLHMDLAGPFLNKMWLIIVDANSKWPEVFCLNNNTTSSAIIHRLVETFARFGIPEQLVSDNGRQFTSGEFAKFCQSNKIKHIFSSAYHPRTNGEAERFIRTFKGAMETSDIPIELRLQRFLISYRVTAHSTTHSSPSEILQGRKIRTLMDLVHPDVSSSVRASQLNQEKGYNRGVKVRHFQLEQHVWVQTYMRGEEKWSLGIVNEIIGPVTYVIKVGNKVIKRHVDQLRAALTQDNATEPSTQNSEPASSSPP